MQDGTVLVTHGGTEMGQGLHTKIIQIAARALGVPVAKVHISETSTDKVPNTAPTAASVSSDLNGMAVLNACNELVKRLAPVRAAIGPQASWEQLVHTAYMDRVSLSAAGFYAPPDIGFDWATRTGTPFAYFSYGAACAEVELDALTGDHTVLRADVLMDVGKSLNPAIDVGQVEGAFVQGAGWCTLEELVWARGARGVPDGWLLTRGPGAYKIPAFNDVPLQFNVALLARSRNPRAIHSSKVLSVCSCSCMILAADCVV